MLGHILEIKTFLGHIVLFVKINYEGLTNKCYALSIILGVSMESALHLLSPLIAITPQSCLTINIYIEIHITDKSDLVLCIRINYGALHRREV